SASIGKRNGPPNSGVEPGPVRRSCGPGVVGVAIGTSVGPTNTDALPSSGLHLSCTERVAATGGAQEPRAGAKRTDGARGGGTWVARPAPGWRSVDGEAAPIHAVCPHGGRAVPSQASARLPRNGARGAQGSARKRNFETNDERGMRGSGGGG